MAVEGFESTSRRRPAAFALVASLAHSSAFARADDPPRRPLPDYAGRPPAPPGAGEIALWVPRVVFFPVYLTTEFLIRRPLGAAISAAERAKIPTALYNFFAFGPDHKAGFVPTLFVDFGFNPSVGVYLFWDDALFAGDDLRMHVSTWGSDWIAGSFVQRIHFFARDSLTLRLGAVRRPDYVFYGLGPRSLESARSRYGQDRVEGSAVADFPLWRSSRVQTALGVRAASFRDDHFGSDPTLTRQVAAGAFELPPGFAEGFVEGFARVFAALDTRRPLPAPGSGIRLEAQVETGGEFDARPAAGWIRWQGAAGAFVDLDGHRRVVSLSAAAVFADPLGGRPVPFTDL